MSHKNPQLHTSKDNLTNQQSAKETKTPCSVQGEKRRVNTAVAGLFKENSEKSERQTECLFGEEVLIVEQGEAMSKVQSLKDGYIGYIDTQILCISTIKQTHIVSVPRTFQYSQADLKKPIERALSMGSKVSIVNETEIRDTRYSILENGTAIISSHLHPIQHTFKDYVTIAQTFIRTPYLWGGVSGFGLDCSGLVQLSMMMTGKMVLRDTSIQQQTIGKQLTDTDTLERGDLIFWKGHVAIMIDHKNIIHANGYSMDVMIEPLEEAITRIAKNHKYPVAKRRPL
ncbi:MULTISPECIES: C40 family peptidase [unclassified Bartonella]|uniref:C40 family peptidase n=1 Tax=unclassified Bartonella TaxID=2645622 RepID=UPI000999B908|nr:MULTISPECIES: NlpC/P60 family protein [unclassified Bartonella]AQX27438.1 NlpC/P60 family protein [Bartonella sp. JB15]AQX28719.1 NlpC/P60 family protein [Bartonella sp. JB63]